MLRKKTSGVGTTATGTDNTQTAAEASPADSDIIVSPKIHGRGWKAASSSSLTCSLPAARRGIWILARIGRLALKGSCHLCNVFLPVKRVSNDLLAELGFDSNTDSCGASEPKRAEDAVEGDTDKSESVSASASSDSKDRSARRTKEMLSGIFL